MELNNTLKVLTALLLRRWGKLRKTGRQCFHTAGRRLNDQLLFLAVEAVVMKFSITLPKFTLKDRFTM